MYTRLNEIRFSTQALVKCRQLRDNMAFVAQPVHLLSQYSVAQQLNSRELFFLLLIFVYMYTYTIHIWHGVDYTYTTYIILHFGYISCLSFMYTYTADVCHVRRTVNVHGMCVRVRVLGSHISREIMRE